MLAKEGRGGDEVEEIPKEVGRTVRAALRGWPETIRLCILVAATTAAWTFYQLLTR